MHFTYTFHQKQQVNKSRKKSTRAPWLRGTCTTPTARRAGTRTSITTFGIKTCSPNKWAPQSCFCCGPCPFFNLLNYNNYLKTREKAMLTRWNSSGEWLLNSPSTVKTKMTGKMTMKPERSHAETSIEKPQIILMWTSLGIFIFFNGTNFDQTLRAMVVNKLHWGSKTFSNKLTESRGTWMGSPFGWFTLPSRMQTRLTWQRRWWMPFKKRIALRTCPSPSMRRHREEKRALYYGALQK